jgi:hypothetical protein
MKTCSNCRWWKDAELVARISKSVAALPARYVPLGYCEPECAGPLQNMTTKAHHGLTAEDYHCSEYKDEARGVLAND